MDELRMLPGVGKQRAGNIVVDRPYDSIEEVAGTVDLARYCEAGRIQRAD
jgi:radical SAM superfamily enzyme with C-terminal helix-hairpin-helix motif